MIAKKCKQCGKALENNRASYCDDRCKWRYNTIKKDRESHMPPVKKRNNRYFSMLIGSKWHGRGQGKRIGHMIKGSMSAMIPVAVNEIVPVTEENLKRHFAGIPGFVPSVIVLGNGERLNKDQIYERYNIKL